MGGDTTVSSTPGKGSTFTLTVPAGALSKPPIAAPRQHVQEGNAAFRGLRVLLVDDNAINRIVGAAFGMLVVETIAKTHRAYFHQNKPIKTICRELKLSRKDRAESDPFGDYGVGCERSTQPMPKLGAWREQLDGLLAASEGKPARERPTLIRIFEALRDLGFEGGYVAVSDGPEAFLGQWRTAFASRAAVALCASGLRGKLNVCSSPVPA